MLYSNAVIDWYAVVINLFWIIGLAILLASFSYHYWLAGEEERPLKVQLKGISFQKTLWFSIFLISLGAAGTSQHYWEIAIWTILTLICAANLFKLFKEK
ncbi:MAG: hypothetical protein CSB13_07025 [Chloroflexi bacterium]|nr:MAG: hypothetical protein CSB13_07025 [Chloroflexota bacterium]